MKVRVHVSLKPTVLDPQGKTILSALHSLGYEGIEDVRQGKFFDLAIDSRQDPARVRQEVEKIAHEVLANPVIEEYQVQFLD